MKMLSSSMIALTILGLFVFDVENSNGEEIRHKRSMLYHGPIAQINQEGNVAFTPEVQQAKAAHHAALAAEFQKLREAERFQNPSSKYSYGSNIGQYRSKYNQPTSQQYNPQVHIQAPLNYDGTVANTAEVINAAAAQKTAFASEYKKLQEAERLAAAYPDFTSPSHGGYDSYSNGNQDRQNAFQYSQEKSYNYRPQFYNPAPLNKDGTVALTPEVQQARAAHQAAFAAEFQRYQDAARLAAAHPDFTSPQKVYSSYNKGDSNQNNAVQYVRYNQQAQKAAPLNQYGSVAKTAQVQYAAAAQLAAFAAEFKRLQYAANLAAAHPDLTSGRSSYSSAKSQTNQGSHYAYNPLARIPAPLNPDGTVAHTAEYKAIAAAHQAEHAKALRRNKQYGYFSFSQHSQPNNYHGHY